MRRRLPFDYALRNAGRRPMRSLLAVLSSALVAALLLAGAAFVRGLERSHLAAAPERTAILLSSAALRDLLRSAVTPAVADLVVADVPGIRRLGGEPAVSAEIHMGTDVRLGDDGEARPGFVRGVTSRAFLVHDRVTLVSGEPFGPGEVMVGRLAAKKMGLPEAALHVGSRLALEGGTFTVSGVFAAPGTTIESEIWAPLLELQGLTQRQDVSAVFVRVADDAAMDDVDLFSRRRLDLEIESIPARVYYAELAGYFGPILALARGLVLMLAIAATVSAANGLSASVQDRSRELATLRALGYPGRALVAAVLQEALLFAVLGGLLGLLLARSVLERAVVSMAMSAFTPEVDAVSILLAFGGLLILAVLGTVPALCRLLRLPVAAALKEA